MSPTSPMSGSATASIDISDHNIRPNERLATVLHLRPEDSDSSGMGRAGVSIETSVAERTGSTSPDTADGFNLGDLSGSGSKLNASQSIHSDETLALSNRAQVGTPDSEFLSHEMSLLDSEEEQAAIRIQSAFRGYRTRKTSPYRKHQSPSKQINSLPTPSISCDSPAPMEDPTAPRLDPEPAPLETTNDEINGRPSSDESNQSDQPTVKIPAPNLQEEQQNWSMDLETPTSLELDDQTSTAALTAELESGAQSNSNGELQGIVGPERKESDASIELDMTDSSLLGAALSMNDESSSVADNVIQLEPTERQAENMSELEYEAQRLVNELDSLGETLRQESSKPNISEVEALVEPDDDEPEPAPLGSSPERDDSSEDGDTMQQQQQQQTQRQQGGRQQGRNKGNRNRRRGKK